MKFFPLLFAAVLAGVFSMPGRAADQPTPSNAISALSPFGFGSCYTNNRSAQDNARWIPRMAEIGLTTYRTAHCDWGAVEREQGKFDFTELDKQWSYLTEQHMVFGGTLIGNPKWNTADRPGSMPVHNLAGWSSYVSAVVKHAQGKVKYWEIWNEPPNFTGKDQTPEDLAKIVTAAYDAAKAADPSCLLGLAAKSAHVNYLEQVIKAGAREHFDFITLHPYEVLGGIADNLGTEPVFLHIVPTLRKMLAAQDPAKTNVPVIFTELGCDTKKGADRQANALVKAYALGIAQGVACIQWFEGMDGDSGPMGLLDRTGAPRPSYTAMAQLIAHLGQHPAYLGWVQLGDRDYGFVFQGAKSPVLVAWARRGDPEQVEFGQTVKVVKPSTGETTSGSTFALTTTPILVPDAPAKLVAQAKSNKARPLLWGGDFTAAKAVSMTMGEHNVEQGLHTLSGDAVAEAVVAYGGSARAGSVPGGSAFTVDPGFLSYTTVPIEITVVVRRNEANDNSGFKLVYESTNGFKTAGGWYTVPDNKEWHTKTWRIDDAQFVNYWGFNFHLESDGNKFNKYYLQSVKVTKLEK